MATQFQLSICMGNDSKAHFFPEVRPTNLFNVPKIIESTQVPITNFKMFRWWSTIYDCSDYSPRDKTIITNR